MERSQCLICVLWLVKQAHEQYCHLTTVALGLPQCSSPVFVASICIFVALWWWTELINGHAKLTIADHNQAL